MVHFKLLMLTLFLSNSLASAKPTSSSIKLSSVEELSLNAFQTGILQRDLPATDILLDATGNLWILGKQSVWRWSFDDARLQKVNLPLATKGSSNPLRNLGSDGVSLFAASDQTLYKLLFNPAGLLQFRRAENGDGRSMGFVGSGDDFWWLHSAGMMYVDRYGKKLEARHPDLELKPTDQAWMEEEKNRLWVARDKRLLAIDLNQMRNGRSSAPALREQVIHQAKHRFEGLQAADSDLFAHTAHTVLRFSLDGKLKQAIPVEGDRRLIRMAVKNGFHAYFFNDQLLETFDIQKRAARRYRLDVAKPAAATRLAMGSDGVVVILAEGVPHVFRLGK